MRALSLDLSAIAEPILALPNHPDLVAPLSEVAGRAVDEVFIGSCMATAEHLRQAARILSRTDARLGIRRLWICAPTRMDHDLLVREGMMAIFGKMGARVEMPGCSLCMGNQARVEDGAVVLSTSTRNFDNRMGKDARVYLGSAMLAAVTARLGRLPTVAEYRNMISLSP